jgi:hypothetical protein
MATSPEAGDGAELERALRTARSLLDLGHSEDTVFGSGLIDASIVESVRARLAAERTQVLTPVRVFRANADQADWLAGLDRSRWHYWTALRQYLLTVKGWSAAAVRRLDDSSDAPLRQLAAPETPNFDVRGLVLGYVQSGKTANYTALIAKAADAGYRLVIVLAGIDNGLRRQTQLRLDAELVGRQDGRRPGVPLPPVGLQWIQFTTDDLSGDFRAGNANHGALQGSQPVLLVVKKNGAVLRRLLDWLRAAPNEVRQRLPVLVVDDEADQASIDTSGSYQTEDEFNAEEYEPPTRINERIRQLLALFSRTAYVAYTATPYANILIPHDNAAPDLGSDLYPSDFIIELPKPQGYFGAEEFFGRPETGEVPGVDGIDVVRHVAPEDIEALNRAECPPSLASAIDDFVLAGAARGQRGDGDKPATMLVHTSPRIEQHGEVMALVESRFDELKEEWRYQRQLGVRDRLQRRWDAQFRPVTRASHLDRDVAFDVLEPFIGPFLEQVACREVNSATGAVLDYEQEPRLKAIAVGGNRLSRGLTLEGLLVSYFVRSTNMYDTLMQMGRWFGYRSGYEDLMRLWTTPDLHQNFGDLAFVEHRLRLDLDVYQSQGLRPVEVGMRIWQHPTLQVTSRLKRRFAAETRISQSYSFSLEQTFKFPLDRPEDLASEAEVNRLLVIDKLASMGQPTWESKGPVWRDVPVGRVLELVRGFRVDPLVSPMVPALLADYIERQSVEGELVNWTVAVRGRDEGDRVLGTVDWQVPGGVINGLSRTRMGATCSLGVITTPGDEAIGLTPEQMGHMQQLMAQGRSENVAARSARPASSGLLLLYPISKSSGHERQVTGNRRPLYENPRDVLARDLVGLAVSLPESTRPQPVEAYLEGTVGWRPVQ